MTTEYLEGRPRLLFLFMKLTNNRTEGSEIFETRI